MQANDQDNNIDEPKIEEVDDIDIENAGRVAIAREKIGVEPSLVVNEITDTCIYSGFFGILDSQRLQQITERVLDTLTRSESDTIIIDLSNVDIIDSAVAAHLLRLSQTINVTGCSVIFCGIKAVIAQTMTAIGVDISSLVMKKNLKVALKEVLDRERMKRSNTKLREG